MTTAVGTTQTLTQTAKSIASTVAAKACWLGSKSVEYIKVGTSFAYTHGSIAFNKISKAASQAFAKLADVTTKAAKYSGNMISTHKGPIAVGVAALAVGVGIGYLVFHNSNKPSAS